MRGLTLVSMSGLRVCRPELLEQGLRLPGLKRRAAALAELPPLGLLTVAAAVDDSWDVRLVSDVGTEPIDQVAERIAEFGHPLAAFSTLTAAADRAYRLSEILRSRGVTTILGGLHATTVPEECQRFFDVVVIGDGDTLLPVVLEDYLRSRLRRTYRMDKPFRLAEAPQPRWDLLGAAAPPRYTVQTTRGCPWACNFCAASRLLGPPRSKPADVLRRELAAIASRSRRPWIELADDNTFAVHDRIEAVLDLLSEFGARWFSESDWRIGQHPTLLPRIAASGCRQLLVGVESTVFQYPGMGLKAAELPRMMEAIEAIQAAGIVVNACFIVGGDGENPESLDRLGDFLDQAPFGEVQITLQTPFPGTGLFRNLKRQRRILAGNWSRYTLFDVTYQPSLMTVEQLQAGFADLIQRVFRPEAQGRRDRIVRSIRQTQRSIQSEKRGRMPNGAEKNG